MSSCEPCDSPNSTPPKKNHTPLARRVISPIHESCTACILGVARGTSAMNSDSGGEHPADIASGPSDAHVTGKRLAPKSLKESNLVSTPDHMLPPPSLPAGASAHVNFAVGCFILHPFFCFRLPLLFLASFSFSTEDRFSYVFKPS
jgi:hypothetical protein